eukprot:6998206-Prymnesium_polylepis.1
MGLSQNLGVAGVAMMRKVGLVMLVSRRLAFRQSVVHAIATGALAVALLVSLAGAVAVLCIDLDAIMRVNLVVRLSAKESFVLSSSCPSGGGDAPTFLQFKPDATLPW